jgi:hypothetical protein
MVLDIDDDTSAEVLYCKRAIHLTPCGTVNGLRYVRQRPFTIVQLEKGPFEPTVLHHELHHIKQILAFPVVQYDDDSMAREHAEREELEAYNADTNLGMALLTNGYPLTPQSM